MSRPAKKEIQCTWPRCSCKATGVFCINRPHVGPKPRKAIARQSAKAKSKTVDTTILHHNDAAFYLSIWQERPHKDFETGEPIPGPFVNLYFHHVLEKRNFPQYRYCKWNIVLLTWSNHTNADNRNWRLLPKVGAYTEKLMQLHELSRLDLVDPNTQHL